MKIRKQLHVVTTGRQTDQQLIDIVKDIHPFITALHIREKTKTANELAHLVVQLTIAGVPLTKLIVNDRVDVAECCRVMGVQLTHHSLDVSLVRATFPEIQIGCSVHSVKSAQYAEQNGANFLLYGHIFHTDSKPGKEPRGLHKLNDVSQATSLPVIAIGGIKPDNVRDCVRAGASGIAVMSGVLEAESPLESVLLYRNQLEVCDDF